MELLQGEFYISEPLSRQGKGDSAIIAISPLPPSVNKTYKAIIHKEVPMMVKTPLAKQFKEELQWRLRPALYLDKNPRLAALYVWNMTSRDGDTDNRLKLLNDSMEGKLYINDKVIGTSIQCKRTFHTENKQDPWKDGCIIFFTNEEKFIGLVEILKFILNQCEQKRPFSEVVKYFVITPS